MPQISGEPCHTTRAQGESQWQYYILYLLKPIEVESASCLNTCDILASGGQGHGYTYQPDHYSKAENTSWVADDSRSHKDTVINPTLFLEITLPVLRYYPRIHIKKAEYKHSSLPVELNHTLSPVLERYLHQLTIFCKSLQS